MSIIPYNNFTVRDLSNVQQPYINSTSEVGEFSGRNLGTIAKDKWYSLPAVLYTNNGIASVSANNGLTILSAGIYKINLSLFPTATQDGSSNISFNFGTTYLSNIATTNVVNAFGGPRPTGMFTYDPSNNPYTPGIITWITDGYNSANSTPSNFIKNPNTNELSYNYFNAGYSNSALYSGNCTTEMTFFLDSSATIYFNVSTNSNTSVTMGNCSFTLELICNNTALIPTLYWHKSGAPLANWSSIASDGTGSDLAACVNGGRIWTSNNYGVNWTLQIVNNLNWSGIVTSNINNVYGQFLVACVNGGYIYKSSDFGANWFQQTFDTVRNWTSIAANSGVSILAACVDGGGIWRSGNSGTTWIQLTDGLPATANWSSITTNFGAGFWIACVNGGGIWRSAVSAGTNWIEQAGGLPPSANWTSLSSFKDSTSSHIAAASGGGIWFTTNSGSTWAQSNAPSLNWSGVAAAQTNGAFNNSFACAKGGGIYQSQNFATTWSLLDYANGPPKSANWSGIATSTNAGRIVAGIDGGYLWAAISGDWFPIISDASRNWSCINGSVAFAATVSNGPYVYTAPYDVTHWFQQNADINRNWSSIASDSTGTKLAVIDVSGGGIWVSTNSGVNWSQTSAPNANWKSIASDSTGTNLAACVTGGGIWTSTNSGANWFQRNSAPISAIWSSIASSSDGNFCFACVNGASIWKSSDSGATWDITGAPNPRAWTSIASDSTGTNIVACTNPGGIWKSSDSGDNWSLTSAPIATPWTSIASDSTGANLAACSNVGGIWVSTDYGANWILQTSALPTSAKWRSIASSSNGTNLAAVTDGSGNIYTRIYT